MPSVVFSQAKKAIGVLVSGLFLPYADHRTRSERPLCIKSETNRPPSRHERHCRASGVGYAKSLSIFVHGVRKP